MKKDIVWDKEKNIWLKNSRGVEFKEVAVRLKSNRDVIRIDDHPNQEKYPNQKLAVIWMRNYAYVVAYIREENRLVLKTVFPSRKETKRYLRRHSNGE